MSRDPAGDLRGRSCTLGRLRSGALAKASTRHTRLAFLGAILGGHIAALYWPRVDVGIQVAGSDKLAHALLFAVPVLVASRALGSVHWPALLLAAHAPTSELVQHYLLPGRSGDPRDVLADLFGVAAGAGIAWWWASPGSPSGGLPAG